MASISVNGVKHQSGAGAHPTKDRTGRKRTRSARRDAAITEEIGKPFRLGNKSPERPREND
jgi:hypothetical protein